MTRRLNPDFLAAALRGQRDLRDICDAQPATPLGFDIAELQARWPADPGRLVRFIRDLTHLPESYDASGNAIPNRDHLPGYSLPYVCRDTGFMLVMQYGVTLEGVLASIRSFRYIKTRGFNQTMLWENVLRVIPSDSQQATELAHLLHVGHAVFDPNQGMIVNMINTLARLIEVLTADEQVRIDRLVAAATARPASDLAVRNGHHGPNGNGDAAAA